jgi:peptidoglycan hydrolase-like protein with peptidoglycan-binding domain
MSSDVIKQIQKALQNAGHDPKYIDGVMGWRTTEAIKAYQKEKGLAVGGLTDETIKSLGIKLGG